MTGERYIQSVVDFVPPGLPLRDQIALDLRAHIAERVHEGRALDDILAQLGDPLTLAESYLYTVTAEYLAGHTLGKRLMGIRVVRESGARIGLGQSFLRQLPFFGGFSIIDALFALFTERRQRAFELLTKTRAVALLVVGFLARS